MYESKTSHLYPNFKKCPICEKKLDEWYRRERTIKTLTGKIYIVCHIFACKSKECSNYKVSIQPEEESKLAIKGYHYGLDVVLKIGVLRYKEHKTHEQIQKILFENYQLKISDRTISDLEKTYLSLIKMVIQEDSKEQKELHKLSGIILSIDGIKPDSNDDQLFLIREVQTGHILAAKLLEYTTQIEIENLLQDVIKLGFPILGIVSDSEKIIKNAIKNVLPNTPHQLCQYHYLKRVAHYIKQEDVKLKKKIRSSLLELRKMKNRLFGPTSKLTQGKSEKEIQIAKSYFLAITQVLKIKSVYPLKPAGLIMYEKLTSIKQSMKNCSFYKESVFFSLMCLFLDFSERSCSEQAQRLKTAYQWINKINSLLAKKSQNEKQAQENLKQYVQSISSKDETLNKWAKHIKKITNFWVARLFRYLTQPLLPKTNNELEHFNHKIKRTFRKITGRKNTQSFLVISGAFVSSLLTISFGEKNIDDFSNVNYLDFITIRNELTNKAFRSSINSIQKNLDEYLFDLELQWN